MVFGADTPEAEGAGVAPTELTPPAPSPFGFLSSAASGIQAAASAPGAAWSELIEFKDTEDDADVAADMSRPRGPLRRFWPVLVSVIGLSAVSLGVVVMIGRSPRGPINEGRTSRDQVASPRQETDSRGGKEELENIATTARARTPAPKVIPPPVAPRLPEANADHRISRSEEERTKVGPVGGEGGTEFADKQLPKGARVVGVKIRHGAYIDGIELLYKTADGKEQGLGWHGGDRGEEEIFLLEDGEYISGITGTTGLYVDSLMIVTNKRKSRKYGRDGPPTIFDLQKSGEEVTGFYGRSGAFLNQIGIFVHQRPDRGGQHGRDGLEDRLGDISNRGSAPNPTREEIPRAVTEVSATEHRGNKLPTDFSGPPGSRLAEQVEPAIKKGASFLKQNQRQDGSWADIEQESRTGMTSLVTLALLSAGERSDSPTIRKAVEHLRQFGPRDLHSTYAISLQTMAFAQTDPERDRSRIAANARWLEQAQIKPEDPVFWPGSWTYSESKRARPGDNSNSQHALLGLHAASEAGVPVRPEVWQLARNYWEKCQRHDGSWAYTPDATNSTASMTCAGVSSLIIAGLRRYQGQEFLQGDEIKHCGKERVNPTIQRGIDWLANHFFTGQNFGTGQQWRFYYLSGLERTGRLAGVRFFGEHDWYRLGAAQLAHEQNEVSGFWRGVFLEEDRVLATSFALLFLAKGRAPVLINKVRHGPSADWQNDPDDVRNLTSVVSRDWKNLLTWQVVDPAIASVAELLQAPIVFFNGHDVPEFNRIAKQNIREFVEQGGVIFADACCSSKEFDAGFKDLMKELFPEEQYKLRPLPEGHPVWRARHLISPNVHPLWGIERGGKTVVIYSPQDLSCYWNQMESSPANPAVIKAIRIGQNAIEYATGHKLARDKLSVP
jgi:hypothetical protein